MYVPVVVTIIALSLAFFPVVISDSGMKNAPSTINSTVEQTPNTSWGVEKTNATGVWEEYGTMGSGTKVAVLDSGVNASHPDINVSPDARFACREFGCYHLPNMEDKNGHGTATSSLVSGGNSSGKYLGTVPDTKLLHGKVLHNGSTTAEAIINGIEWAVSRDVDVVSISLVGGVFYDSRFIDVIRDAREEGTVVVGAIGNMGNGTSSSPANIYDAMSVGSVDDDGDVSEWSSGKIINKTTSFFGSVPDDWPQEYTVPTLSAPGESVSVADNEGGFYKGSGTSLATPYVAGIVALIQSATPHEHPPKSLYEAIEQSAEKPDSWNKTEGRDTRYGAGIVDAYKAVEYLKNEFPKFDGAEGPAKDTTGDGLLNDVNGDGGFDVFDVQFFFNHLPSDTAQNNPWAFDFDENGEVNIFDVQSLFSKL